MLLITLIKVIVLMSVASIMAIKKKHSFEIGGFFFFFCKIKTKMIVGEKQGLTILTLKYSQILKTLI